MEIKYLSLTEQQTKKLYKKEILAVGIYKVNGKDLEITDQTLQQLKTNFDAFVGRGGKVPLVFNHDVEAESTIGWVVGLWIDGNSLYASLKITDKEALAKIPSTINEVSVGIADKFTDGIGNEYETFLYHIGAVVLPIYMGQEDFTEMSIDTKEVLETKEINMNEEMFKALVALLNEMLGEGYALPETVSPDTLVDDLKSIMEAKKGMSEPVEEVKEEVKEEESSLMDKVEELSKQLYSTRVETLLALGSILPCHKKALMNIGQNTKWNLSSLEGFANVKPFEAKQKVKTEVETKPVFNPEEHAKKIGFKFYK
ncbi:MAG: hypothetical protein K2X29_05525 [Candidatus Obscuribacterales bacterium]|nr:hypothetical protein [Candidatus Obscuribacterales bacterium]